jgi:hypothetical protein
MGYIQDRIESDRKISEAFQELAADKESHEAILKAIKYLKQTKNIENGKYIHKVCKHSTI